MLLQVEVEPSKETVLPCKFELLDEVIRSEIPMLPAFISQNYLSTIAMHFGTRGSYGQFSMREFCWSYGQSDYKK